METGSPGDSFPQSIVRYSVLRYLQKRVAKRCAALPDRFDSLDEWQRYRARLVDVLREKLPVWELNDSCASRLTACADLGDDLRMEAVDVPFEDGFFVPVHVYGPRSGEGRLPAVIVCPGYQQRKNDSDMVDMGIALARAGMLAVLVEYDGTGERADRPDPATDINNVCAAGQLIGITNVGLRVMTNLATLRYLRTREDVDAARIGITGLCQGSIITWYTAAVCKDLAAAAPLCGITTHEAIVLEYCNRQGGWSGISPYVFGLLDIGDVQHIVAAVAPRPLFVQNNMIDIHWPLSGFQKVKDLVQHVYGLYGAEDRCRFRLEHGPHAFAEPFCSNIVGWFRECLGLGGM